MLKNRVVIVTGATKGIGAAISREMATLGTRLVLVYKSDHEKAQSLFQELYKINENILLVQGDLAEENEIKKVVGTVVERYGFIDVLINNAGVYQFDPLGEVSEENFHKQFNNNVFAPLFLIKASLPYFNSIGASVVNIGSIASLKSMPSTVVYSSTKAALDSITTTLATELAPKNIRVNAILPGPTHTDGNPIAGTAMDSYWASIIPLGRIWKPEDVVGLVSFLASEKSDWVTGQKICVSGGL